MPIRLHRATESDLAQLLQRARPDSLTYAPAGISLAPETTASPAPQSRHWSTRLHGNDAFERAVDALVSRSVHRGTGRELAHAQSIPNQTAR